MDTVGQQCNGYFGWYFAVVVQYKGMRLRQYVYVCMHNGPRYVRTTKIMRPITTWMRSTVSKWIMRFIFRRRNATTKIANKPSPSVAPTVPCVREVRLGGVRSHLVLISLDGVGVSMMRRRRTTDRQPPKWEIKADQTRPATRLLSLCRNVRCVVPSDFGLDSLIVHRTMDGVRVYFGPDDDISGVLSE